MADLKSALESTNIVIRKFDPSKARPVYTAKTSQTIHKFTDELVQALGPNLIKHPAVVESINSPGKMEKLIEEYIEQEGLQSATGTVQTIVPKEISHLTLNVDRSSNEAGHRRFFCTTKDELVDPKTSGQYYMDSCKISPQEAVGLARSVVPRYMPRRLAGIHTEVDDNTQYPTDFFNTYIPPKWELWKKRNPKKWAALPDKPPEEVVRFLKHLIPVKEEREFLYSWTYHSLLRRAYVFLVLSGTPGAGKNRLKLLLRSLHGAHNSADGKKETFGANQSKFNSQMEDNTMIWFDELKYDQEMEPRMKEYQNDYIPIERKGIDATRSTEIYCSMIISNNYPRDNYLLFNSRKFAPLVLAKEQLTKAMKPSEISKMSDRLDDTKPTFDVKYVAQIAKWIMKVGQKYSEKWPNLEYQGPKFWELAHTSMSRWQKIAVVALTTQTNRGPFPGWDDSRKAFLWSKVEESLRRKKEYESKDYRDSTTVKAFFETYCDSKGVKVFEVESVEKSVVKDFWIKPLVEIKTIRGAISTDLFDNSSNGHSNGNGHDHQPLRPPGISDYKWRQMKEQHLSTGGGFINGKDKDTANL